MDQYMIDAADISISMERSNERRLGGTLNLRLDVLVEGMSILTGPVYARVGGRDNASIKDALKTDLQSKLPHPSKRLIDRVLIEAQNELDNLDTNIL